MNRFLRRSASALLALTLTASLLTAPAAASYAMGEDLSLTDVTVNEDTVLSRNVFWSTSRSDLRTENLITYTPNGDVKPIVTYGSSLTACTTVTSAARELEAQGYRVVAGINGDFFNVSTGLPIGIVVSGGEIKSSDGGYYAIGFRKDGTALLGKPGIRLEADLGYVRYDASGYPTQAVRPLAGINKARVSEGGIYLYTYDFNSRHTTGNTEPGVDVICSVQDGRLAMGETVTLQVEEVRQADSATPIRQGQVVLSVNAKSSSYYVDALAEETVGNLITLTISANDGWEDVEYAVGALYSLLQDGEPAGNLNTAEMNPRTAVGQKSDGTLVFYTMDGRRTGVSIGASMSQVAQRLLELGCVNALCLDGGGSTTLTVTTPDSTAAATYNSPSESSLRAVSNQIFLVAENRSSGSLHHFYVSPTSHFVLAGSSVEVNVSAVDSNYIPMHASHSADASAGTLTELGSAGTYGTKYLLTAPEEDAEITVTASRGSRTGSATVYSVATPDSITVKNGTARISSLTLNPGSSVQLTASALYNHLPLTCDASAFRWEFDGDGEVTDSGLLTVRTPGEGTLSVTAGSRTVEIPVTAAQIALQTAEDFENGLPGVSDESYGTKLDRFTGAADVMLGRWSGSLTYQLTADGSARCVFARPYTIPAAYDQFNLWLRSDRFGNDLYLLTEGPNGPDRVLLGTLPVEDGWLQLLAPLPAGTTAVTGLEIAGAGVYQYNELGEEFLTYPVASGTLWLDQLVISYGGITDSRVPAVTAEVEDGVLTARISDVEDGRVASAGVTVTYDGHTIARSYSGGKVTAQLPEADGAAHRVTVLAKDASGNIGRASCAVEAAEDHQPCFTDTEGHWAADFVDYLYTAGITTGYADGTFHPNQAITRQQFAAMLFRYLELDAEDYEDLKLPFADSAQIGSYAQTAVKALYSMGIISGTSKNGKLYFNPNGNLTRAQAAAMIGRTQEKGYASADLSFTDAASIPAYAMPFIRTMAAQGVIGGYADGSFRPAANITRAQMAKILFTLL